MSFRNIDLASLSRKELQTLAKEYSIKANLSSKDIIKALLNFDLFKVEDVNDEDLVATQIIGEMNDELHGFNQTEDDPKPFKFNLNEYLLTNIKMEVAPYTEIEFLHNSEWMPGILIREEDPYARIRSEHYNNDKEFKILRNKVRVKTFDSSKNPYESLDPEEIHKGFEEIEPVDTDIVTMSDILEIENESEDSEATIEKVPRPKSSSQTTLNFSQSNIQSFTTNSTSTSFSTSSSSTFSSTIETKKLITPVKTVPPSELPTPQTVVKQTSLRFWQQANGSVIKSNLETLTPNKDVSLPTPPTLLKSGNVNHESNLNNNHLINMLSETSTPFKSSLKKPSDIFSPRKSVAFSENVSVFNVSPYADKGVLFPHLESHKEEDDESVEEVKCSTSETKFLNESLIKSPTTDFGSQQNIASSMSPILTNLNKVLVPPPYQGNENSNLNEITNDPMMSPSVRKSPLPKSPGSSIRSPGPMKSPIPTTSSILTPPRSPVPMNKNMTPNSSGIKSPPRSPVPMNKNMTPNSSGIKSPPRSPVPMNKNMTPNSSGIKSPPRSPVPMNKCMTPPRSPIPMNKQSTPAPAGTITPPRSPIPTPKSLSASSLLAISIMPPPPKFISSSNSNTPISQVPSPNPFSTFSPSKSLTNKEVARDNLFSNEPFNMPPSVPAPEPTYEPSMIEENNEMDLVDKIIKHEDMKSGHVLSKPSRESISKLNSKDVYKSARQTKPIATPISSMKTGSARSSLSRRSSLTLNNQVKRLSVATPGPRGPMNNFKTPMTVKKTVTQTPRVPSTVMKTPRPPSTVMQTPRAPSTVMQTPRAPSTAIKSTVSNPLNRPNPSSIRSKPTNITNKPSTTVSAPTKPLPRVANLSTQKITTTNQKLASTASKVLTSLSKKVSPIDPGYKTGPITASEKLKLKSNPSVPAPSTIKSTKPLPRVAQLASKPTNNTIVQPKSVKPLPSKTTVAPARNTGKLGHPAPNTNNKSVISSSEEKKKVNANTINENINNNLDNPFAKLEDFSLDSSLIDLENLNAMQLNRRINRRSSIENNLIQKNVLNQFESLKSRIQAHTDKLKASREDSVRLSRSPQYTLSSSPLSDAPFSDPRIY